LTIQEFSMPLVRINISQSASPETVRIISDVIYDAMTSVANVPANDRFQIITRHSADELVYHRRRLRLIQPPSISITTCSAFQVIWTVAMSLRAQAAFPQKNRQQWCRRQEKTGIDEMPTD
jgi:hypothetical protein